MVSGCDVRIVTSCPRSTARTAMPPPVRPVKMLVMHRTRSMGAWVFPAVALSLAVYAAAGPWLLSLWIHADFDRYAWVIHQGDPCSDMGGGPGMLWVFGTSWLAAVGAVVYAGTSRLSAPHVVGGLGLGAALLGATAAAMFPNPAVFARVLGCI